MHQARGGEWACLGLWGGASYAHGQAENTGATTFAPQMPVRVSQKVGTMVGGAVWEAVPTAPLETPHWQWLWWLRESQGSSRVLPLLTDAILSGRPRPITVTSSKGICLLHQVMRPADSLSLKAWPASFHLIPWLVFPTTGA